MIELIINKITVFELPLPGQEKILFEIWSSSWDKYLPVKLICYDSGQLDLHCQTGNHHKKAIALARKILNKSGFKLSKEEFMGPTGLYYSVSKN